ncbi:MAG: hypothetical protein JW895_18205 [Thermoleophilaceae bacterium]|nr:hypothetical protein [Thermoleophilaceae bacterium]
MIEPAVYRAAFVPALLAVLLAMFSLEDRPRPLPQGLAADVLFDGRVAAVRAAAIAEANPDRTAGTAGDRAVARLVATQFAARGFRVEADRFTHAGRDLVNVIGRRVGSTRRQVVVVAERDSSVTPDAPGSASDTAALLELARIFEGRATRKTLVLASTDGSTLGEVGAIRLAESLGSPAQVDAVIVVSDLGSRERRGSFVQPWSNDSRRAGIALQRTASDSIRQELDRQAEASGSFGQLARLSFPIGVGAQGPLLERGFDAVRISGSGELPPAGSGPAEEIDEDRLGTLGRAALRTLTAVDARARAGDGPETYLLVVSQVVPGWVLALLAGTLLLPVIAVSVDALARARRRRVAVLPWARWIGAWLAALLCALAMAELLALAGATPAPPPAPMPPEDMPLDGAGLAVLGAVALAALGGWLVARRLARRPEPSLPDPTDPGAGVALALALAVAGVLLWMLNPAAALVAVPAAHLWALTALTRPPPARRARAVLVGLGALPVVLVWVYHLFALSIDPLESLWYLLLLVTGHTLGLPSVLIGCLWLAALGALLELTYRTPRERPRQDAPGGPPVYGPGRYLGPGSLGGTKSALRR